MEIYATKIKQATFRYIESELYDYKDTLKEIKRLRESIINSTSDDENTGGGQSNIPGDPTGALVSKLATHKTLQNLVKVTDAIQEAYEMLSDEHRSIVDLKYFKNKNLYWDDVAYQLSMHRNTVFKYRREFILVVANKLGLR